MATKKKSYWYILVITSDGPVFATAVNYVNHTAEWNKALKPLTLSKETATDIALGLCLNAHTAFAVCTAFELDKQPCNYRKGHFVWEWYAEIVIESEE